MSGRVAAEHAATAARRTRADGVPAWEWTQRGVRLVHVGLQIAYCWAVLVGTPSRAPGPGNIISGTDSTFYTWAAQHWPWEPTAARVAPLAPTVYAAVGVNPRALVIAQTAIAILAWQCLAVAASRLCRRPWIGVGLAAALLALSVAPEVIVWNAAIASESIAISCMVGVVAGALTAVRRGGNRWWVATAGLVAISVLARDTFVILSAAVVVVALFVLVRRPARRRAAVAALVLCVSATAASQVLANQGDPPRWYYPFQENITLRVLRDPDLTRYFLTHSMPQVDELRVVARNYYLAYPQLENGPKFEPFRVWLRTYGQSVYVRAIIRHPGWVLAGFAEGRDEWVAPVISGYTRVAQASPGAIYGAIGASVYWRASPLFVVCCWLLALLVVGLRRLWTPDDRPLRSVLAALWCTGALHVLLAYVGDVLEVGRHTITGTTQIRIVVLLVIGLVVDRISSRRLQAFGSGAEVGHA